MHVDITPEQREKIIERYEQQLAGMVQELEDWYPDKRLTSAQLRKEHGNFTDRLGALANELGYKSSCELLRFEGFDIELDRKAAANPTPDKTIIRDSVDGIIDRVSEKLDSYIVKIDEWYPDGDVTRFAEEHKKTKENLNTLALNLGFDSWVSLLAWLGYTVPANHNPKGGRPKSIDPIAILQELESRYEGIDPAPDLETLKFENPDFAQYFKTISNSSREVFGDTWSNVLKVHGILAGNRREKQDKNTLDSAEQLLDRLKAIAEAHGGAFATCNEAEAVFNDKIWAEYLGLKRDCEELYGKTITKLLRERGIVVDRSAASKKQSLTDEEIEGILTEIKQSYAHAVRPKNLKSLEAEQPLYAQNAAAIKRYLKAHGYSSAVKYFEDQECISRFVREDSLPRPQDDELEADQVRQRMTVAELLEEVPNAYIIEFDTSVEGSEAYGQPPFYEMLRVGDCLEASVDRGTWVHLSFCGHDLGLVGWHERYEYCLVDYIGDAEACGVVNGRVYAQITGFAGGPIAPKALVHMFFAVDPAKKRRTPVKREADAWGYIYDSGGYYSGMTMPAVEDVYDDATEYAFSYNAGSPDGFSYSFWMPASGDGDDESISSRYLRCMC